MDSKSPNYLRAAFLNVYNLSLLGGALSLAAATGDWFWAVGAAAGEALWMLLGPEFRPFQRAVDRSHQRDLDEQESLRVTHLVQTLPERYWQRAKSLSEIQRDVERDVQHNPSFQAALLQPELDKLHQLYGSFVALAAACVRAENYLAEVDLRDLERQQNQHRNILTKPVDSTVRDLAAKNASVLERRLKTIEDIQTFLARAKAQMTLIENTVQLLRDQVLTMASPAQLGEQLSDLLLGVEAIQSTANAQRLDDISAGAPPVDVDTSYSGEGVDVAGPTRAEATPSQAPPLAKEKS